MNKITVRYEALAAVEIMFLLSGLQSLHLTWLGRPVWPIKVNVRF